MLKVVFITCMFVVMSPTIVIFGFGDYVLS